MMTVKIKLVNVLVCMLIISIKSSQQSVVKEITKNLPTVDSSMHRLDKHKMDLVIPRREDDFSVLATGAYEVETLEPVMTTSNPVSSLDDSLGGTEVPDGAPLEIVQEEEQVEEEGQQIKSLLEAGETFAVFGTRYRPTFPVDEPKNNVTGNSTVTSTTKPTVEEGPSSSPDGPPLPQVGLVDVSLAKLATIKVLTNSSSQIDVFVSRRGSNCTCGKPNQLQRIVNGEPVKINQLPWTAALFKRNWLGFYGQKPFCGGTLINDRYVVTASHCVDGASARSIKVRLNEEDVTKLNENEEGYMEFQVEKIMMHEKYNRRNIDNDLALLKLVSPVELKEDGVIVPACLPASNNKDMADQVGTVAGWGAVSQSGSTSSVLRKVDVPIMSNQDCNTKTVYTGKITDNMLCAGYLEGGKDSCQGDSGGPLVIKNDGRYTLVGVVSWGYGCARKNSPGVYTRVARYPDWILEKTTKDAVWCQS